MHIPQQCQYHRRPNPTPDTRTAADFMPPIVPQAGAHTFSTKNSHVVANSTIPPASSAPARGRVSPQLNLVPLVDNGSIRRFHLHLVYTISFCFAVYSVPSVCELA